MQMFFSRCIGRSIFWGLPQLAMLVFVCAVKHVFSKILLNYGEYGMPFSK